MNEHQRFDIVGTGCWCPPERTLSQMRWEGHTADCAKAREGWAANNRHLSALARERAVTQEVGRQLLAEARAHVERSSLDCATSPKEKLSGGGGHG